MSTSLHCSDCTVQGLGIRTESSHRVSSKLQKPQLESWVTVYKSQLTPVSAARNDRLETLHRIGPWLE